MGLIDSPRGTIEIAELALESVDFLKNPVAIKVLDGLEISKALRKMSNHNVSLIIGILYRVGPMNFGELSRETGLQTGALNHVLTDLKGLNLLVRTDDKKYHLTKYCVVLYNSLYLIMDRLAVLENPFSIPTKT